MHFHIPVEDMTRAKKFYSNIFGWEIKETGMGRDYQLAATTAVDEEGMPKEPGAINGALYLRENPDEVEKAGGKVIWPISPVGDFGLYAQISDTEGNVTGLWQDVK